MKTVSVFNQERISWLTAASCMAKKSIYMLLLPRKQRGQNCCSESRRGFTRLLKGTLTVITERKETVNHSLHAQMISSDLQPPTTPTFLMSILINGLVLSLAGLCGDLKINRQKLSRRCGSYTVSDSC